MKKTVLLVDDNAVNRRVLQSILCSDYHILEAENGDAAFAVLTTYEGEVSAVLTDIAMPVMGGYELLREMKSDPLFSGIPVVMVTGAEDEASRLKALSLGASDFILKPCNPDIIKHCVKNCVALYDTSLLLAAMRRDTLTGLYTRESFFREMEHLLGEKTDVTYTFSVVNVENFKVVNDQYGTEIGDKVLRHIGERLNAFADTCGGLAGRYMADKFMVLYPTQTANDVLEANHIALINTPLLRYPLHVRIGRYAITDDTLSLSAILDRATMAEESIRGRADIYACQFNESMLSALRHEQQVVNDMLPALRNGEFEPWFQPQYNHATETLVGAEALVRWRKDGALVLPNDYIAIFERNGFIYEVDQYVWRQVCILLRRWLDEGKNPLPVSVNVSRFDVLKDDFLEVIEGLVKEYNLPLDLLRLEITESAFSDTTDRIVRVVNELIDRGFTVEIDDFGSGYSSLNTLKDVPASILKLDMKFFAVTKNTQRGGNIVESVVRMAKWLGMSIIAEGVEDKEQADYLKSIGCYYIQGYYYAKPMPAAEYEMLFCGSESEPQLAKLQTVDTLDNNEFWNPKSMETLIFNSYVGGACIFEYKDGNIELLRINDRYAKELNGLLPDGVRLADAGMVRFMDQEGLEALHNGIRQAITERVEAMCEVRLCHGEQTEYIRVYGRMIAEAGDRYLLYGVVYNITEQRLAEDRDRASSHRLRTIMDNINGGITSISVDANGVIETLFANDGFYALYGYTREQWEAEGMQLADPILPEDREDVLAMMAQIIHSRGSGSREYRCRKRDGSIVWSQATNSVIGMADGKTTMLAIVTDTTDLHRAQAEKDLAAAQLKAVMDRMPCGITAVAFYPDGLQYLLANDRFYEMQDLKKEDYNHGDFFAAMQIIHPEDRDLLVRTVREAASNGTQAALDYRILRRDGSIRWIKVVIDTVQISGVNAPVQVSVYQDITDEIASQEQLRILNDSARDILAQPDTEKAIAHVLHGLMNYFNGDRAYIFELKADRETSDNTYEVCAPGIESAQHLLRNTPLSTTRYWYETFARGEVIAIPDVNGIDDAHSAMRDILRIQNISSLIVVPLRRDGAVFGFMGIDNPRKAVEQLDNLSAISDYVAVLLTRRDLLRKVQDDDAASRLFVEDIPGGYARINIGADGSLSTVYVNELFCDMRQMSREELLAAESTDSTCNVHPDDLPMLREKLALIFQQDGADTANINYRLRCGSGAYKWFSVFARRLIAPDGRISIVAYYTDISEQKDEEYQQIELLDNLPIGAALFTYNGERLKIIHINKRYWDLVERVPVAPEQISVFDAIHRDDLPLVKQELASAIRQKRNVDISVRVPYRDGEYRPFHITATASKRGDGTYLLYASYTPISEESISLQELFPIALSTMMSSSEDLSFVMDKDLRYLCCSKSDAVFLGLADERDIAGKTDFDLFDHALAEKMQAFSRNVLETGIPLIDKEELIVGHDGVSRYVKVSKYPIKDGAGHIIGLYGISRDITEQRETKSQMELLTASIPGGIATFRCFSDHIIALFFNEGLRTLSGYQKGTYTETKIDPINFVFDEDKQVILAQLHELIESGRPIDCNVRIHTAAGGYLWLNTKAVETSRDADSVVVSAVLTDITALQEERERLRQSEELSRLAMEQSGKIITRFDVASRTITMPGSTPDSFQIPHVLTDLPDNPLLLERISPQTIDACRGVIEDIVTGKASGGCVYQQKTAAGWRWLDARYTTVFSATGEPVSAVVSFSDITEQQEKEVVYQKWLQGIEVKAKSRYTLLRCNLSHDTDDYFMEGTLLAKDIDWSKDISFTDHTQEFVRKFVHPDDRDAYLEFLNADTMIGEYYRGHRSDALDFRMQRGGVSRWLRLSVELVEYPNSGDIGAYLLYEDIDESKRAELQTIERADKDPLTGLLNRVAFATRVEAAIKKAEPDAFHALLMLDIDNFKLVNDTFGHGAGDQTLIELADSLRGICRRDDLIGRLGGDEFVVFLPNIFDRSIAAGKAEQICVLSRKTYSQDIQISSSVGIAFCPDDGTCFEDLYKVADASLYRVKKAGKGSYISSRDTSPAGRNDTHATVSRADVRKPRILIVDDNEVDLKMLSGVFKNDFLIETAASGAAALVKLRHYQSALSVVLLDLIMPDMDGFAVLQAMQEDPELSTVPVIIVSADDEQSSAIRAIRAGAADYVTKPVDASLLRLRISSAVSKAENERLRAQNSYLSIQSDEVRSYQAALERSGLCMISMDWSHGVFIYSPDISRHLAGTYDTRGLWPILLTDGVASPVTVQELQQFVFHLASTGNAMDGQISAELKSAEGQMELYNITAYKVVTSYGLPDKIIMLFQKSADQATGSCRSGKDSSEAL